MKALGPTSRKSAPLKPKSCILLTDRAQQMERWVEHYSKLYSRQFCNTFSPRCQCSLPPLDELYLMLNQLWTSWYTPSNNWSRAKPQEMMAFPQFAEARSFDSFCPTAPHDHQMLAGGLCASGDANIITLYKTGVSLSWALSANSLPESFSPGCRSWQSRTWNVMWLSCWVVHCRHGVLRVSAPE